MAQTKDLESLVTEYLSWQNKKDEAESKLATLKEEIVALTKEKKIKKFTLGQQQLLIVSQAETRFPQIGEQGRKEIEKIVKESGEVQQVLVFDIIALGNLYDRQKLSPQLMEKLRPFAKKVKTAKIVVKLAAAS